jgi:hypothetical protein
MSVKLPPGVGAATGGPRKRGRYRHVLKGIDGKNRTEKRYEDEYLAPRKASGEVIEFDFEPESLKLTKDMRYIPDFRVLEADGTISFVDVKAGDKNGNYRAENSAINKIKIAVEKHPYRFWFAWPTKSEGWKHKEFTT